ncbi:hypothetical protein TNCV_785751 [Trichonephila clavipes]|nr:hypothetical protein TNCV_785751 [Trichonephila clavipes]
MKYSPLCEILRATVVCSDFPHMDDNAHPYHTNIVNVYLVNEDISVMEKLAYFLDLNLIENIYDALGSASTSLPPPDSL